MLELSRFCLHAAMVAVGLAIIAYVVVLTSRSSRQTVHSHEGVRRAEPALVGAGAPAPMTPVESTVAAAPPRARRFGVMWLGERSVELALAFLTLSMITRTIVVKHAPLSNQYEFALAFCWGMLVAYVYFQWRYQARVLGLFALPATMAMLVYTLFRDDSVQSLLPALQHGFLLPLHVFTAVLGYGAACVGSAAGFFYLIRDAVATRLPMPSKDMLEEIGYRAVVFAFPLMTLTNILGAIWADIAWGSYWSWDPKEVASLITWLVYGAYLHARVVRDWRGNRAAMLLILGFVAVLGTFFGNHFLGGMHSYGREG